MTLDDICKSDEGDPFTVADPKSGFDLAGRPLKQTDATVRVLLANGVANLTGKDAELDAEKKYIRGKLARKIRKGRGSQPRLSIEELGIVKEAVGKFYMPEAVSVLWDFLENELTQAKEQEALDELEKKAKKAKPEKLSAT